MAFRRPCAACWEKVALALAGRAGSRLARALGAVVSRFTLIRLLRGLPDPEAGQVTVLGSYLDSAAAHGIPALDAIRDAITGKPWLPPLPALG
jgi:hypothetical protein